MQNRPRGIRGTGGPRAHMALELLLVPIHLRRNMVHIPHFRMQSRKFSSTQAGVDSLRSLQHARHVFDHHIPNLPYDSSYSVILGSRFGWILALTRQSAAGSPEALCQPDICPLVAPYSIYSAVMIALC